ncbi:hypothetical protein B296_00037058, partial [Ensete ventricosum]
GALGVDDLTTSDSNTQLCVCKGALGADGPTATRNSTSAEGHLGWMVPRRATVARNSTEGRSKTDGLMAHNDNEGNPSR